MDNTAAIGTIRRGYSHLEICQPWLRQWATAREEHPYTLHIVYIPSAVNVADKLSHFQSISQEAAAETHRRLWQLSEASNGIHTLREMRNRMHQAMFHSWHCTH